MSLDPGLHTASALNSCADIFYIGKLCEPDFYAVPVSYGFSTPTGSQEAGNSHHSERRRLPGFLPICSFLSLTFLHLFLLNLFHLHLSLFLLGTSLLFRTTISTYIPELRFKWEYQLVLDCLLSFS